MSRIADYKFLTTVVLLTGEEVKAGITVSKYKWQYKAW